MPDHMDFFDQVYEVTKRIPPGRVTTYGAIASCLGSPQAARTVGWAMNVSHLQPGFVPAHRVVNRIGLLTGKHHFRHPGLMQELLESEGIIVIDDRVRDFAGLFWDPCKELI
ncbi:MAG: MGMT family protein [Bacteroidales bacterium]|nr:MGMT family protein [Bacteroidales bacterium]